MSIRKLVSDLFVEHEYNKPFKIINFGNTC